MGLSGVVAGALAAGYTAVPARAAPAPDQSAPAASAAVGSSGPLAIYDISHYSDTASLYSSIEGVGNAVLRNGPTLVVDQPFPSGNTNSAVALDGTDDYADTPVTLNTAAGFTVASWVKLDRVDRTAAVISQSGNRVSNFRIGLDAAGKWQFTMARADADSTAWDTVTGPAATVSKWTHLTGVYDAAAAKMTLYVNGVAATAGTHTAPWAAANGGVQWGRGQVAGGPGAFTDGNLKQLWIYQDTLDARRVGELVVAPARERADRCYAGHYLHAGGPAVKALAGRVLAGTAYDRRVASHAYDFVDSELNGATWTDQTTYREAFYAQGARYDAWGAVIEPYTVWGDDFGTFHDVPEYGEEMHRFLMQRTDDKYFVLPAPAKPAQAELDRALAIAAEMRAVDPWFAPADWQVQGWSASQIARFLRFGGYPKTAPAEGTLEYRTEVESVKLLWAACEPADPDGTSAPDFLYRKDGPLSGVVETARKEWAAELAAVAAQRNTIVAAETRAQADVRSAAAALVEAQGQAWVVGQLFKWQKYWAGRPKTDLHYPPAAHFTKAKTDITTATNAIAAQLNLAKTAATSAQNQSTAVTTALTQAAATAKTNKTPLYRGLEYARQSSQVTKASAASALSAQKAIETTLNAAKATNADGAALQSLALVQQSAMQAEFRRVAAQEAAAQAKAAATAAAEQAAAAAAEATRARNGRATAVAAEAEAKKQSEIARAKRIVAESERDKAATAHDLATAERRKAATARDRAEQEQAAAAEAESRAGSAADTAIARAGDAQDAEYTAKLARDRAIEAERNRDATAARSRSLEALAAAAAGTSAAGEARAAADDARAAAADAATAASSARSAADSATAAAVSARAAAIQSGASAKRSRAAADASGAAAAKTRSAYLTATAAAADALQAAENAAYHADQAELEAAKAAEAAVTARVNADAAKVHADAATAESARTAGAAFAAAEAAFAARDSAAQAVTAANEAITMGTPFAQTDASAGFAVLVGQSSKTIAQQQAATAQTRADEAAKAAKAAADLAAKAQADAKVAAQAAAAAAADAAAAAQSALQARASAVAAAADAAAAQAAADRAAVYDNSAQLDALHADIAATTAESEARQADAEATDAERDAGAARTAATRAETSSKAASGYATRADSAADDAEESAANANEYARQAQDAATRAEEQQRRDELAAREGQMSGGGPPAIGEDDLAILLRLCGQQCVDEYRAALQISGQDVLDWVKANGGQILLDMIGWTDAKACFTEGDIEGCLWTAVNAISTAAVVLKIPAIAAAIVRISTGIGAFFRAGSRARKIIDRFTEMIERSKKGPDKPDGPSCPWMPPVPVASRTMSLSAATDPDCPEWDYDDPEAFPYTKDKTKLHKDGKYRLKDGDTEEKIYDPKDFSRTITDIDWIKDGVLWENKSAKNLWNNADAVDEWVETHIGPKIRKYIEARKFIKDYENAPVGFNFHDAGIPALLRPAVEKKVAQLRLQTGVDIRIRWPS